MSTPRFDEIEGEEETAPRFDDIEGEEAPAAAAPEPPPAEPQQQGLYNALRSAGEATGLIPSGVLPGEGTARGAAASLLQGYSANWADELAGQMRENDTASRRMMAAPGARYSPQERAQLADRIRSYMAGGMDETAAIARASGDLDREAYVEGRNAFRNTEASFRQEHPAAAFALNTLGGMLGPSPGGTSEALSTRLAGAGLMGGVGGAGAAEEMEDVPAAVAVGVPLGVGGQALGEAAGDVLGGAAEWVRRKAQQRVINAEHGLAIEALKPVVQETASAKGTLGAAVQSGNRGVENMMRLSGNVDQIEQAGLDRLEASGTSQELRNRLARSLEADLPGKVAEIDAADAAYKQALSSEERRFWEKYEQLAGPGEVKRQIMDRVKRYGPPLAGYALGMGAAGGTALALGAGPQEAAITALAGAGIRPAVRAVQRMASNPSVQRAMFAPVEAGAEVLGEGLRSMLSTAGAPMSRAVRAQAEAAPVRGDASTTALVEQLARESPEALGPYAQRIQQAAANDNLALVHYTLQQTDPQYRALLDRAREGGVP